MYTIQIEEWRDIYSEICIMIRSDLIWFTMRL
nr:MAG TPA: hypothetical protein [Caudoviricetes sp.]